MRDREERTNKRNKIGQYLVHTREVEFNSSTLDVCFAFA